ncbi:MAG TPA: ABC transporter permease [Holophagaceae bacterium]|jgi:putative ABC transport system permease protein|nr:ABC transporter permease [Holophagaceae bacterium]
MIEFIKLALFAITRNKTRAFLTMLGIIIGVGSVIVMIGIGQGSKKASEDIIRSMGTNLIMIFPGSSSKSGGGPVGLGGVDTLTPADADAINAELKDSVSAATSYVRAAKPAVYADNNWLVGTVAGADANYLEIKAWNLDEGRYFTEQEVRSQAKVCVIGKTVQDNLFPGGEDPVGKTIRIGNLPFEVVGALERKGGGPMGDQDDTIHAPYTTVMRKIKGSDHINFIIASANGDNMANLASDEITALLRQRHKLGPGDADDFTIRRQDDWIQASAQQAQVITVLLTVAAGISLIVGGIGIANIMLVSVTERTREIGVRRALGATQKSVMLQFLIEAVVLAIMGGLIGVGLSLGVIGLLQMKQVPALVQSWAVLLGIGFSGLVGIAAGFLPAVKAAKLDVIDALRYE